MNFRIRGLRIAHTHIVSLTNILEQQNLGKEKKREEGEEMEPVCAGNPMKWAPPWMMRKDQR